MPDDEKRRRRCSKFPSGRAALRAGGPRIGKHKQPARIQLVFSDSRRTTTPAAGRRATARTVLQAVAVAPYSPVLLLLQQAAVVD